MKNNLLKSVLFAICCTLLLGPLAVAQTKTAETNRIKMNLVDGFLIVLKIKINGAEKEFFVDTGTTTSAISEELAKELKLSAIGTTNLLTTAGSKKVDWSRVKVNIGSKEFSDVPVLITDFSAVRAHSKKIDGVLGNNILETFNYFVDYKTHEFIIEENDEIGGKLTGETLFFKKTDGRMIITTNATMGTQYRLVIDSGSITPVLFVDEKLLKNDGNLYSVAGAVSYEKISFEWRFGNSSGLSGEGVKLAKGANRAEDGLLPIHLFDSVYINNQYKIVMLNPVFYNQK